MSQKVLLREYFSLCPDGMCKIDMLSESEKHLKNDGYMILVGKLQHAEVKNGNGRKYSKRILEREDQNYQKFIRENRACGQLDHPESSIVELKEASHVILRTWFGGNGGDELFGTLKVLNTPNGNILKNLVKDGINLGISSRGLGSVTETRDGSIVNDDFVLIAYDVVSDPSSPGAFINLQESKQYNYKNILTKSDRIYRCLNEILSKKDV